MRLSRPSAPALAPVLASALALFAAVAGFPDATTIIRLHPSHENSSPDEATADYEVHTGTNSLGKLLLRDDRTYTEKSSIYTLSTLEGTAGVGTWSFVNATLKHELILPTPRRSACEYNNGGCQIHCRTSSNGYPVCSCPYGFQLEDNRVTCRPSGEECMFILHHNGSFRNPGYPQYDNKMACIWYLITSPGKRIRLEVPALDTEQNYDILYVYEGFAQGERRNNELLTQWSGTTRNAQVVSRSNVMSAVFRTDQSNIGKGFTAKFQAEEANNTLPSMPVLQLNSVLGTLSSTISGLDNEFCTYVVHKSHPDALKVKLHTEPGYELEMRSSVLHEADPWYISRFTLPAEVRVESAVNIWKLLVELTGLGSAIVAVSPCSTLEEDIYSLGPVRWADFTEQLDEEVPDGICYNGGIAKGECVCPPGFTGLLCEEGCGPNAFGNDCRSMCSDFQKGCKNMIFCRDPLPCTCGAGFTGQLCSEQCRNGSYGAGCKKQCGHCQVWPCDVYTGKCNGGCEPGFYPPLCQKAYLSLSYGPKLEEVHFTDAVISVDLAKTKGRGSVYFYQVQYKEQSESLWVETQPIEPETLATVSYNITGLKVGTKYKTRVILISEDGNSYQLPDVPALEFETLCRNSRKYEISFSNITSSSFNISWQYQLTNQEFCPVHEYEVILETRGQRVKKTLSSVPNPSTGYSYLLAGHRYGVRVCAITTKGAAPCSIKLFVNTTDNAPGEVRNLRGIISGTKLGISWDVPLHTGGVIKTYRIKYQCVKLLGCSLPCADSAGELETRVLSAELDTLLPHAQYIVKVSGVALNEGPYRYFFATTRYTRPSTAPAAREPALSSRSNTSATVQWQPPADCSGLNGYLLHYRYELVNVSDGSGPAVRTTVLSGTTESTRAAFAGLSPMTQYEVIVYVVTSGGWNPDFKLVIPFTTSATAPEAVRELEVYKRGRRTLGLRWAAPDRSYGPIRTFTVAHRRTGGGGGAAQELTPRPCHAWPALYCHTVQRLAPDVNYTFAVSARNVEVDEDGAVAEVTSVTHEGAPGPPEGLRIANRSSSSLQLQWAPPRLFNGLLRSFLVNVEQMDSAASAECCEYFPVQELPVREESALYSLEVSGLPPASMYTVSVSAKTVTLGPAVNATSSTAPEAPEHLLPPTVVQWAPEGGYIVLINSDLSYPLFNSTYLLLILPREEPEPAQVWDEELSEKLHAAVGQTFHVVAELKEAELAGGRRLRLGSGGPDRLGQLAELTDPPLQPGAEYRAALALVLRYRGAASVALAAGEAFIAGGPEPE